MVALSFDPLYFSLVVFFSALIPGVAIGWPLLRKSELSLVEKLGLSFFAGFIIPPALMVVENSFGVKFSLFLAVANLLLVTAVGAFFWLRFGLHKNLKIPSFNEAFSLESAKAALVPAILILIVFLAFYVRLQSYSPIYSELDPYFYVYGTGQLIRDGTMPYAGQEDTAWWPEASYSTHRSFPPLKFFTEAQWYALYTGGAAYNNYLLFVTASWLPPLSAALMAFGAYLLFSSYFSRKYGLLAAFLTAFLPVTIFKMGAGVNESAPFGLASVFIVLGIYALAMRKNDLVIGALAGLAFFASLLSSNYATVILYPVAGFIVLAPALSFALEGLGSHQPAKAAKPHQSTAHGMAASLLAAFKTPFILISALLMAGFVAGTIIMEFYSSGISGLMGVLSPGLLLAIGSILAATCIEYLSTLQIPAKKRLAISLAAVFVCALVLFIPNPIGNLAKAQISNYVGAADFSNSLSRTIAEQNQAGASFEGEAGFLALVPASHIQAQPKNIQQSISNIMMMGAGGVSNIFSFIGNGVIGATDAILNRTLGKTISTSEKTSSLLFVFLGIATIGLMWDTFVRREKSQVPIAILLLLLILPIS
ncbi:MAG: hypothetical protein NT051_00275, partial [Candidatus Micrarchaeota archaeon]|nr:hypothetical protein [Candidatus Micrarchaeota archaeon]